MPSLTINYTAQNGSRIIDALNSRRLPGESDADLFKRWLRDELKDEVYRYEYQQSASQTTPDDGIIT